MNPKKPQFDFKFDSFVKKKKKITSIFEKSRMNSCESQKYKKWGNLHATKSIFLKMYGTKKNQSEFVEFI